MSDTEHTPRPPYTLRTDLRDLLDPHPQPLPPLTWPRRLRLLPHALVALAALALAATGADLLAQVLAIAHAAMLLVALRRPVLAWWLSSLFVAGIAFGHPPTEANALWSWLVQAGVLFLLALRNRPTAAAAAGLLSAVLAVALGFATRAVGGQQVVVFAVACFAAAVFLGATARGRREARQRLAEQIAVTARERALRTVLEERARIARELHDVVAHHMSVISIQADAAPYRVTDPPRELVAELASIRSNALEGLTELRRLVGVLRADEGVEGGGKDAAPHVPQPTLDRLDDLLATVRGAGLRVTAHVDGPRRPLPPGVELSAYRIAQEALSNVLRHAPGADARVELVHGEASLSLRVVNGPTERAASASSGAGHGILGMRERAAMLGGDFSAGPVPGGGYEVVALLPVAAVPTSDEDVPA